MPARPKRGQEDGANKMPTAATHIREAFSRVAAKRDRRVVQQAAMLLLPMIAEALGQAPLPPKDGGPDEKA
jgi:hypothetical protein